MQLNMIVVFLLFSFRVITFNKALPAFQELSPVCRWERYVHLRRLSIVEIFHGIYSRRKLLFLCEI